MKNRHYYAHHIGDLKERLKVDLEASELRALHEVRPWRHCVVVVRLLFMTGLCAAGLWQGRWPWVWPLAALVQGFNILGYIILLHEQVHDCIFRGKHPAAQRLLGWLYAFPAAMSATQFRIWHLDHHNELGSTTDDPKRAHLSPKVNRRWYKLLYVTPLLFWIYARASSRESGEYSADERRAVRTEQAWTWTGHLVLLAGLVVVGGGWVAFRVYAVPLLFTFPFAFVLNRLGQHYDVDAGNPAKWSTRVDGNAIWHFLFLWSNFHIEHHYFPRVPFYNLRRLNRSLHPFFRKNGLESRGYRRILWGWFVLNRAPHTDWNVSS